MFILPALLAVLSLAAGCGLKGPLYLPEAAPEAVPAAPSGAGERAAAPAAALPKPESGQPGDGAAAPAAKQPATRIPAPQAQKKDALHGAISSERPDEPRQEEIPPQDARSEERSGTGTPAAHPQPAADSVRPDGR